MLSIIFFRFGFFFNPRNSYSFPLVCAAAFFPPMQSVVHFSLFYKTLLPKIALLFLLLCYNKNSALSWSHGVKLTSKLPPSIGNKCGHCFGVAFLLPPPPPCLLVWSCIGSVSNCCMDGKIQHNLSFMPGVVSYPFFPIVLYLD